MKHPFLTAAPLAIAAVLDVLPADNSYAQFASRGGHIEIPASSIEQPEHIGVRAHTNYKMFMPAAGQMAKALPQQASPRVGPPYSGYFFETPASLGCVYQLVSSIASGCNPNSVSVNPTGGSHAIAIVDAHHYPTAAADLSIFSAQFGLRQPSLQVVYASGQQPPVNLNWNIEEALDIEWAHAMAPGAKIYLVEAASSSFADLLRAVAVANSLLKSAGGGEVSMSWGGSEFASETNYDSYFSQAGVVYFASSGDSPGVIWPSTSRYVVSVGGTSISRNPSTGNFQQEMAWQSGGGGPSVYEPRPSYQNAVSGIVQNSRGTPDVAADADPSTGVWVYFRWLLVHHRRNQRGCPGLGGHRQFRRRFPSLVTKRTYQDLRERRNYRRRCRLMRPKPRLSGPLWLGLLHWPGQSGRADRKIAGQGYWLPA